jgi:GT2 family glycosyltransferase
MADPYIVRSSATRQTVLQQKIKEALAKKPGRHPIPTEQLNRMVAPPPAPNPPRPPQIINSKQSRLIRHQEARPVSMNRPTFNMDLFRRDPMPLPPHALYTMPDWFLFSGKADISIIVPLYRSERYIQEHIKSWDMSDDGLVKEIIYVDDACPSDSKQLVINAWKDRSISRPVGKVVAVSTNCGYARACNIGATYATGDYLIFLNSDTRVTSGWVRPMYDLFADPAVGIVGNMQLKDGGQWEGHVDSAGSEWSWRSMSFEHIGRNINDGAMLQRPMALNELPPSLNTVGEREMVTGCCLMIRKNIFDDISGFDPNYKVGYWEDSELCLNVRELGWKILFQPASVIWHQGGGSGAAGHKHYNENVEYFRNRWIYNGRIDNLVKAQRPGGRPPVDKILVKRMGANGDVLTATAILPALKKKWPAAKITFCTACRDVLFGNPHIEKIISAPQEVIVQQYQLIVNLDLAYEYHPNWPIIKSYAFTAGVKEEDCKTYLSAVPCRQPLPSNYAVVHAKKAANFDWVGRYWKVERLAEIVRRLRNLGIPVVNVGTRGDWELPADVDLRGLTTMNELSGVVKDARLFIGVDSFPMHLAEMYQIPGVVFFGSILPEMRLARNSKLVPITAELDCLGCHHRQKVPCVGTHVCSRGDLACETQVATDAFWMRVLDVLNTESSKSVPLEQLV